MTESPRKPGRPKGSSRRNQADDLLCQKVAEKVCRNPSLSTRAAIIQAIGTQDPAGLRRLQGKFRREEMLAAAKARESAAERARQAAAQESVEAIRRLLGWVRDFQQAVQGIAATPFMQNLEQMRRDGAFEQVWMGVQQSSFMQTLAELQRLESRHPLQQAWSLINRTNSR